jgi:hypothetical protein
MTTRPVTYADLAALLAGLGFRSKVIDEHRVLYTDKRTDSLFVLPNRPPETIARDKDVGHVRFQLHWRGLMAEDDFDRRFAPPAPKARTRRTTDE